ncbi:MAG: DUF2341 domain-containing protein [Chitinispirillaceae bacterium]|nr:DUF2341 domain-containing protein [Chitinispirillaceae bacterium]
MKRVSITLFSFSYLIASVFLRCTDTTLSGGGTIETTNGVVGVMHADDPLQVLNTIVTLFPENYDPVADRENDIKLVDTTDDKGIYRFKNVVPGNYVVLARNHISKMSSLVRDVIVSDDSVTNAPEGKLDKSGSVKAEFSLGSDSPERYIYIPGTDIFSVIKNGGSAFLEDVPSCIVNSIVFVSKNKEKYNVLRNEITVSAGKTSIIDQPLWKHSRRIAFNTTASGAGVTENVHNFPVLIRLHSGNFKFTETKSDGQDIKFVKNNSQELAFEIERWDAIAEFAEIWVKIDTVHGNDSSQSITMYWGNPAVSGKSNASRVFDTASGFQGVWHLGDSSGNQAADATINRYNGISPDTAIPMLVEGMVGKCRLFDGKEDFITMPKTAESGLNFPEEGYYTVSAWVNLDTMDNTPHLIVSKGYEQYFLRFNYFPSNSPLWEFVEFSKDETWKACTTSAQSRHWVYLTGVRQGNKLSLYCDGVLVSSTANIYQANGSSRSTANDLTIGKFVDAISLPNDTKGYCFFKGSIDEVRIMSKSATSGWVRLCYMNQQVDDRLIVFK